MKAISLWPNILIIAFEDFRGWHGQHGGGLAVRGRDLSGMPLARFSSPIGIAINGGGSIIVTEESCVPNFDRRSSEHVGWVAR